MNGKCAKQETIAIIENNGRYWIGSNWCNNHQDVCPRAGMETGIGYELCKGICGQEHHAEFDACVKAGENANGGALHLIGHTYCCDNCKKVMKIYGIEKVIIGKLPEVFMSKVAK